MILPQDFQKLHERVVELHRDKAQERSEDRDWGSLDVVDQLQDLCKILGMWLDELTRNDIDHGIVYVVLNHTTWNNDRYFVAWLDANRIPAATLQRDYEVRAPKDRVRVVVSNDAATGSLAEHLWVGVWEAYDKTTKALSDAGLTTWNQFLMAHSLKPLPLGLVWGDAGESDFSHYVGISDCVFRELERHFGDGFEPQRFLDHPCAGETCPFAPLERRIAALAPHFKPRQGGAPTDGSEGRWHSLALCLCYHLWRSYGIWGVNAFLSIPVHHRSSHPNSSSILAIGSVKPLSAKSMLFWSDLAARLMGPIAGDQSYSQILPGITLDDLTPSACRQICSQPLTTGYSLDDLAWKRASKTPGSDKPGESHLVSHFINGRLLANVARLECYLPFVGRVTLGQILRNDIGLGYASPERLAEVYRDGTRTTAAYKKVKKRLTGRFYDAVKTLKECFKTAMENLEQETCAKGSDRDPLWMPLGVTIGGMLPDPDLYIENTDVHRSYLSERGFSRYLIPVFSDIKKHADKIRDQNRLAINVIVSDPEPLPWSPEAVGDRSVYWVMVCNAIHDEEAITSWRNRRGATSGEMGNCAEELEAETCFSGIFDTKHRLFGCDIRTHYGYEIGTQAAADILIRLLAQFNTGMRAQPPCSDLCACTRFVFVNGIGLPAFRVGEETEQ